MPIFSHCWPPAEAVPVGLSDTRKEVPNDVQEIPPFLAGSRKEVPNDVQEIPPFLAGERGVVNCHYRPGIPSARAPQAHVPFSRVLRDPDPNRVQRGMAVAPRFSRVGFATLKRAKMANY